MRNLLVGALVVVGTAAGQQFHPYPVGLTHQSRVLLSFEESDAKLQVDCVAECAKRANCDGFLIIDGFCRQLIQSPLRGGLVHHGNADGLYRIDSYHAHHVFRKTDDVAFLEAEGIHDCKRDPCSSTNTMANSCLLYGECICKSNSLNPDQETFIGPTCSDPASTCTSVLTEMDKSIACPCGTRLESKAVAFEAEEIDADVCVAQSAEVSLSPIVALSECASKYAVTAKLERTNLITPIFRRMGAGTACIPADGQQPTEGDLYSASSAEECMQQANGAVGFQFISASPEPKNCFVFRSVVDVQYVPNGATACYLNSFFQLDSGESVKVQTHEKSVDITSRVTSCLASQYVTTSVNSLELALARLGAVRTVAKSFGYRASDGILVMENQRLKIRLEDQLQFMNLTFQADSDFFCKTLCPCGSYSISAEDVICINEHKTFRSGLEHVRAQMNCVFREDWDPSDPLSVSVLLNAMTCAATYRDRDDAFYNGVLAEGRARAAYVLSKSATSPLHQLLPNTFTNSVKLSVRSILSPRSKASLSASGAEALIQDVQALFESTKATLEELESGLVTGSDNKLNPSFLTKAAKVHEDSMQILASLSETQASSSETLTSLLAAVENLSDMLSSDKLLQTRDDFQQDLASFIGRFPGLSPKFDKEIERANAAFGVFSSLLELIPMIFSNAVRVSTQGNLMLSEVKPLKVGQTDLALLQQAIVQFKILSLREPSLAPLVDAMIKFHDDWYALSKRNDGQVLDLDSTTSYGRFRELMLSVASTAAANAYALIYMVRVLETKHADQDPVWTLRSSGTEMLDGLMLRFAGLFVYDLPICPQPLQETSSNSKSRVLLEQRRAAQASHGEVAGSYKLRESMKGKTSDTLLSCARFHHLLGKVVAQMSMVLGSAFDVVTAARNGLWAKQDIVANTTFSYFVSQVGNLPESTRNTFMSMFLRDRFLHVQVRWSKHLEILCNAFKSSSVDFIPSLSIGGMWVINPNLCSVSENKGLSKAVVSSPFLLSWTGEETIKHGPPVCILNSDGTVTGLYNGTGRVGDMSSVAGLLENIIEIRAGLEAYVALRVDGRVVAWGNPLWGGDVSSIKELGSGVERLLGSEDTDLSNSRLSTLFHFNGEPWYLYFGALKRDGSVVIWGGAEEHKVFRDVAKVRMALGAGAIIHTDRTVSTWGRKECGGDSSSVREVLVDVEEVLYTEYLPDEYRNTLDLSVPFYGTSVDDVVNTFCMCELPTFWARKRDGSVVAWGASSEKPGAHTAEAKELLSQGIEQVHLKPDGALFVRRDKTGFTLGPANSPWSYKTIGNYSVANEYAPTGADSSAVTTELKDIKEVVGGTRTFAVLRSDGSSVVWGKNPSREAHTSFFMVRDLEHVVYGPFENEFCGINGRNIQCWGIDPWQDYISARDLIFKDGGVQRDAHGKFDVYAGWAGFLARTNRGRFVRWRAHPESIQDFVHPPNVPIRQVSVSSSLVLLEDGTVVSVETDMDRRRVFETLVQPRLKDVVKMFSLGYFEFFQSADGSLVAWSERGEYKNWADAFDGMSLGSDVQTSGRFAAVIRDTENGLTSATNQWLRPTHAKQQDPVSIQPSCDITSKSTLSAFLLQRIPQVVDVSLASLAQLCEGNVGVTRFDVRLFDEAGQQLQGPLSLRFKIRPAPGSFEAKYFPTPSQQLLEVISQRSGDDAADEYIVDLATGNNTERTTLASSGDMLPSPYTKWILSLETPWPEGMEVPASISLVFTLSGGACSREAVDISTIVFAGERGFLSNDGVGPLSLSSSCGGTSLLPPDNDESETLAPTTSQVPSEGTGQTESSPPWLLPVAVSGGAVACLVAVATAVLLLKRRKQRSKTDDISAEQISAKL